MRTLPGILLLLLANLSAAEDRLICCGDKAVFIIAADARGGAAPETFWKWTAADSPEIPEAQRKLFNTTDDCKPYAETILITSSSGGVALVRRADKKAIFYCQARNAHSACLLPGERVAVAASTGGDELQIYAQARPGFDTAPIAKMPLISAHGAHWDAARNRLWALGGAELLLVDVRGDAAAAELVVDKRFKLPTGGGHDLSPLPDGKRLYVTTDTGVYTFDSEQESFTAHPDVGKLSAVKSIDQHPTGSRAVYHRAAGPNWWSDTIRFAGEDRTIVLTGERLYKIRWERAAAK